MELTKYVPVGQYLPRPSPVHRLDPRTKILAMVALVVVLFFVRSFVGFGWFAAAVFGLFALGQISIGYAVRGLRPLIVLLLFTVVVNTVFYGGSPTTPLFAVGPLVASREGLHLGLFVGLRLILLVAVTSLLTFTTSPVELTDGLEWMLRPLRRIGVPGHELAMMVTIALRFIPTLLEETERIVKAQMARGAEFDQGNVFRRARAFIPVLVPLIYGAFRRSEELALAMEARCYQGGEGRTRMKELRWRVADAVAVVVLAAASALFIRAR